MSLEDACRYIDNISELETVKELAFSGGEAFLFRDVMTQAMSYAFGRYHLPSLVNSNSYWATSRQKAQDVLGNLYDKGLRCLQTSVDDFHEEYIPVDRVANAVHAAMDLGIKCKVIIVATPKGKSRDYYRNALQVGSEDQVEIMEVDLTPVGYASSLTGSDYVVRCKIPPGSCSILETIPIFPDGSVQLCCGPPVPFSKELNAGNARYERLADMLARAEWNPVFNALSLGRGPAILAKELELLGMDRELRDGYASPCEACQHILSDLHLGPTLESSLGNRQAELYFSRVMADVSGT
jgi:hypothetical protein